MSNNRFETGDLPDRIRSYVREFETTGHVRVGFRVFVAGVGLAALALALFVRASALVAHSDAYYAWVEPAYALALFAVPVATVGIVILLPTDRRMLALAAGGLLVAAVATVGFTVAYPADWNRHGDDRTLTVIAVYAVGLVGLVVPASAALRDYSPELIRAVTEIRRPGSEESEPVRVGERSSSGGVSRVTVDARSESDGSIVTLLVNGELYSFAGGETFGRQDEPWLDDLVAACDGPDGLQRISKVHLAFVDRADGVYVTDLGRNGTTVNGRELDGGEAKLADGDRIVLGDEATVEVQL